MEAWDDHSAAELLRTEHADEVLWQLAWERIPLNQRAENSEKLAIARPIAERITNFLVDLPVEIHLETLYVTIRRPKTDAVMLVSTGEGLRILRFPIDGDAQPSAASLAEEFPAAFLLNSEHRDRS